MGTTNKLLRLEKLLQFCSSVGSSSPPSHRGLYWSGGYLQPEPGSVSIIQHLDFVSPLLPTLIKMDWESSLRIHPSSTNRSRQDVLLWPTSTWCGSMGGSPWRIREDIITSMPSYLKNEYSQNNSLLRVSPFGLIKQLCPRHEGTGQGPEAPPPPYLGGGVWSIHKYSKSVHLQWKSIFLYNDLDA